MSELTNEQVQAILTRAEALLPLVKASRKGIVRLGCDAGSIALLAREVLRLREAARHDVLKDIKERLRRDDADYKSAFARELGKLDAKELLCERDQLRESLRWALRQWETGGATCLCIMAAGDHRDDCPYARH